MKKYTFEELVENESWHVTTEGGATVKVLDFEDVIDLLKQVRQATLQEAANKMCINLVEYSKYRGKIVRAENLGEEISTENSQEYFQINKQEILDLDKESIEINE